MVSTFNLVVGGLAILIGLAWIVRPMTMIYWQNKILYFWIDGEPQLEEVSPTVGRVGGLVLVAVGVFVVAGVQF